MLWQIILAFALGLFIGVLIGFSIRHHPKKKDVRLSLSIK